LGKVGGRLLVPPILSFRPENTSLLGWTVAVVVFLAIHIDCLSLGLYLGLGVGLNVSLGLHMVL
jgi:hypothetical protein